MKPPRTTHVPRVARILKVPFYLLDCGHYARVEGAQHLDDLIWCRYCHYWRENTA